MVEGRFSVVKSWQSDFVGTSEVYCKSEVDSTLTCHVPGTCLQPIVRGCLCFSASAMSRIEVTLYQILADCTLHAKHVLHSSTTHEDNTYYLYEPDPIDPHSGIHVSPTLETRPHAAALRE